MKVSGATNVLAVIGDPVAHSLSPLIHNRWIADAGLDADYVALRLQSASAANDIAGLARAGLFGLNVTLPHKIAALEAAEIIDETAKRVGAANTLARNGNGETAGWTAYNTDLAGVGDAIAQALPGGVAGARVLLVGAGGAARSAALWLADSGAELAILNRTRGKADALARDLAITAEVAEMSDLTGLSSGADLLVNAASLGHSGGALPALAAGRDRPFLDLSYGEAACGALEHAQKAGWSAHDGLSMLIGQAAEAFRIWFGVNPDRNAAMAACRAELAGRK